MSTFESEAPLVPAPVFRTPEPSHSVFIGPLGLRAGWGLLLFFILTLAFSAVLNSVILHTVGNSPQAKQERGQLLREHEQAKATHTRPPAHPQKPIDSLMSNSAGVMVVLAAAFTLSFVERRHFAVYGLGLSSVRNVLPGALWGLVSLALVVGTLRAFHLLVFDQRLLHGGAIARYGLSWLGIFLLVGIFEEFLFRGYIQYTLTRGLLSLGERLSPDRGRLAAFWISAIVWSLLFLSAHIANPDESRMGLVSVFCAGILFSYALWRTGSLWWGIGFHITWDWSQSFLFGVPDSGILSVGRLFATHPRGNPLLSGGIDGPEGSVIGLAVFAMMLFAVRLHPQAPLPPLEPETTPPANPHLRAGDDHIESKH